MKPTNGKARNGHRRKKEKVKYNVIFVPDVATADVKKFSIRLSLLSTLATIVILVIALLIIYCYYLATHVVNTDMTVVELSKQLEKVQEEKALLESDNIQLQEKIVILSDTVSEKLQAEEVRAAEEAKEFIPTGFPMSGTASYEQNAVDASGNQLVSFIGGEGTNVIATAKGIVLSVSGSNEEGYTVVVDHGNGYKSIYSNGTQPKVKEGEEVSKETVIFSIISGHESLHYQITLEENYINPMDIMEVYG